MSNSNGYIFLLWGERFEEAVATIFVTELREAGLRVKMVGLTLRRISGSHGLVLVPDLTLDQALPLATQATCLVIPHSTYGLKRLKNDPRLREFFDQALANQARLVLAQLNETDLADLGLSHMPAVEQVMVYPVNSIKLVEFARQLANSLRVT